MMKIMTLIMSLGLFNVSAFAAGENTTTKSWTVRAVYRAQCHAAGGDLNAFCICGKKENLLEATLGVVDAAVKKQPTAALGIINPFLSTCNGQALDPERSLKRLRLMVETSQRFVIEKPALREEINTYSELGLLDPETFGKYLTKSSTREKVKEKIANLKNKYDKLQNTSAARVIADATKQRLKNTALAEVNRMIQFDVMQASQIIAGLRAAMDSAADSGVSRVTAVSGTLKSWISNAGRSAVKSLGKGFVFGVVTDAGLSYASYVMGVDITQYNPFNVFSLDTPAYAGTLTGDLIKHIEYVYEPGFYSVFDMAMAENAELLTGKAALVAMVAEARYNGDTFTAFLDQ